MAAIFAAICGSAGIGIQAGLKNQYFWGFKSPLPYLVLKRLMKKECEVMIMTPIEKKAKVARLESRISLLERKGAQNANIVKALKRDLKNLTKND